MKLINVTMKSNRAAIINVERICSMWEYPNKEDSETYVAFGGPEDSDIIILESIKDFQARIEQMG